MNFSRSPFFDCIKEKPSTGTTWQVRLTMCLAKLGAIREGGGTPKCQMR
jgi:hypothetical protein